MTLHGTDQYFPVAPEELAPDVADVVPALRALFKDPRLSRVPAEFTAVLSEGSHGADLVVQHPTVRGLSLVIAVGGGRAHIYWAHVTSLEWKDELDAARDIPQATVTIDDGGPAAVAAAVRDQLEAQLRVLETSQFGKRLVTEIRAPDPRNRGQEHTVWRQKERRISVPLASRTRQSRQESFVSML
jgi:hypothetical protein